MVSAFGTGRPVASGDSNVWNKLNREENMSSIVLRGDRYSGNTIVSNCFIDEYMADANGAQLKIYLYLMRCIEADEPVSVPLLADRFNYTETDIVRSLLYWARKGIVSLEFDDDRNVSGITLNDPADAEETEVSLPRKPSSPGSGRRTRQTCSATQLKAFRSKSDTKQLIFAAEQYLARPLTPSDMETLFYINDELGFSMDLIEYLIEYCVCRGKTSTKYIEQTAIGWADAGIRDVDSARRGEKSYGGSDYYAVLKAYGITDRNPVDSETVYVDKWKEEYGFSMSVIMEAVSRTMKAIAKPSFPYTDSILKRWFESGVRTLDDIEATASSTGTGPKRSGTAGAAASRNAAKKDPAKNKFSFNLERTYDFDELEAELLKKQKSKRYSRM